VSVLWSAASLLVAWRLLARRDFAGAPVSRKQGWVMTVKVAVASAGLIALLAIAGYTRSTGASTRFSAASYAPGL
jgi:lysylphosphatidylglycerol synthetase-like protein (DUF2156 family)